MSWKIAAGMQDVDNDHRIRLIQVDEEVLPCPDVSEVRCLINQYGAAPTCHPALSYSVAPRDQLLLVKIGLVWSKPVDGPPRDIHQAHLCATCQSNGFGHVLDRA